MTWQHRTPKAHNPQTSVLESVSDADRVYQHISQLTKHGLGQLQSSGFYLNRFACPKHGGDDANASLHNHGFLYCHSHCGEIPLNEVKGLLGIHGSAPGSTHHITSPDTRPTNVQHKRTSKHSLHDHAQWSAYLQGRHILEPAIAAGAWIEYSDYYGRNCLVWHEKRRDGSRGAGRRRFINPPVINGRQYGKSIWFDGEKTDEPFHYVGTLDELKRAIAGASGELNIVEGETDVWSMHAMGLPNTVGIYGISNIPPDIASILAELDVTKFVYYADNDDAGKRGASKLRALLHESGWRGEGEYRQFAGPGIPEKGDANDLLCHYHPDLPAARAALDALPRFVPGIERKRAPKSFSAIDNNKSGWGPVNEAITIRLGLTSSDFKTSGFTKKNFHCLNPQHEDKTESAGWSRDGFYKCFSCGEDIYSYQVAEWLGIDWRALRWPQPQIISSNKINLDAAPQTDAETAPLSFEHIPDSWLRAFNKFYTWTEAQLFFFAIRARSAGTLAESFTTQEFIETLRPLGCNVSDRSIYRAFESAAKHDNHVLIAKLDPSQESRRRNAKYRLRSLDDIRRRLLHDIRLRIYEKKFGEHPDILIGFDVFDEALPGSSLAITLKSALEPLYREQQPRFDSLINWCEGIIAGYLADLDDLSATPLPDWSIDDATDLPAMMARGIYDADPEDRGKRKWAPLLGISPSSVPKVLLRAGIKRTAYTIREEVSSQREAKERAREQGAKIVGVEVDGGYQRYDTAMDIPQDSVVILQPPAKHEIISDEKQIVKAPPAKPHPASTGDNKTERADNMRKPGKWHEPRWDPQFIYWELVQACCLLHGYAVKDGVGIYDPRMGEVWTNPTLHEVVRLITG